MDRNRHFAKLGIYPTDHTGHLSCWGLTVIVLNQAPRGLMRGYNLAKHARHDQISNDSG